MSLYYPSGVRLMQIHSIFTTEETESFLRNAFLTSISLILSTIIYGFKPGAFSILDGLLVTFLPIIIGACAHIHTPVGGVLMRAKTSLKLLYMFEVIFSAAYSIHVWRTVSTYGSAPGCNANSTAKFVVLGYTVMATNRFLRIFALIFFAISIALAPLAFKILFLSPITDPIVDHTYVVVVTSAWTLLLVGMWVYGVVTVEEIIQRNGVTEIANKWTFGQTLSMALLLGPVFDLMSGIWNKIGLKRRQY